MPDRPRALREASQTRSYYSLFGFYPIFASVRVRKQRWAWKKTVWESSYFLFVESSLNSWYWTTNVRLAQWPFFKARFDPQRQQWPQAEGMFAVLARGLLHQNVIILSALKIFKGYNSAFRGPDNSKTCAGKMYTPARLSAAMVSWRTALRALTASLVRTYSQVCHDACAATEKCESRNNSTTQPRNQGSLSF